MKTLLVIEDDAQWAQLLCAMVALRGWSTKVVGSMEEAVAFLRDSSVDATLLDLRLPDSDMQSSLDAISALKSFGSGPVVIVTGAQLDEHLLLLAKWAGAASIVSKGVRAFTETLIAAVDSPVHA